jgi:serine/threonine protein kinase
MSKLLAQGGFGCIFKPGMYCSGDSRGNKYVSKLVVFDESARNELILSHRVKKIENYKRYFVPAISYCHVNKQIFDKNNLGKKCNIYQKKKQANFILIKLDYLNSVDIRSFFINYNNRISNNIFIYISLYKKLLIQIKKLQSANIVHYDLRPNNILISNTTFNPFIIDFGISIYITKVLNIIYNHKNKIKEKLSSVGKFYRFAPENSYWSFDIHIISYIINNYNGLDNKFTYKSDIDKFKQYVYENTSFHFLSAQYKDVYWANCIKYLDELTKLTNYEVLLFLVKNYKKWDITGLTITFLQLIGYNTNLELSNIYKKFVTMLFFNISFNSDNIEPIDNILNKLNTIKEKQD